MIFIEALLKECNAYWGVLSHNVYEDFNQAFDLDVVEAFSQKIHNGLFTYYKGFLFHWIK